MDLEDFVRQLNESGPNRTLYHYTDLNGLIGIIRSRRINGYNYWTDVEVNKKSVATTRFKNVNNININEKVNIGRFIIDYHIINDYIKGVKLNKINELYIQRFRRLNQLLSIEDKNDQIYSEIEKLKELVKSSQVEREAEERIVSEHIPLDYKNYTIRFEFIDYIDPSGLNKKLNNKLYYTLQEEKYFIDNEYYRDLLNKVYLT